MESTATITCPFCWQSSEILVDATIPSQRFTTDCEVCCRPFDVVVECDACEVVNIEATG